uniref:Radical SAM core domain-containing protein n=1 Tax=Eutreptiella gymnastica TaxID=73025 RepID=A0A7S4CR33_9EUGL
MPTVKGIVYTVRSSLYVALTNHSNTLTLLDSRGSGFKMNSSFEPLPAGFEPTASQVLEAVEAACNEREPPFESIVFAGKGEPTLRLPVMLEVARALKAKGAMTLRLNTNGLCNLHHQRDIVPELQGSIDAVSVALNTADPRQYHELMTPECSGREALDAVAQFVQRCVAAGLKVECTAVERPGVDLDAVRALAESLKASFRSRTFTK